MTISSHPITPTPVPNSPIITNDTPTMWNIEESDLTIFKDAILGKGQFGTVYLFLLAFFLFISKI